MMMRRKPLWHLGQVQCTIISPSRSVNIRPKAGYLIVGMTVQALDLGDAGKLLPLRGRRVRCLHVLSCWEKRENGRGDQPLCAPYGHVARCVCIGGCWWCVGRKALTGLNILRA
jgi:hypothetical protein